MGKLITIVGNSGVGKTTLTGQLRRLAPLAAGLEQQIERPFQQPFSADLHRYALANQVDYLLYRAGQERSIRQSGLVGIQDGGLDQDFHVFTRHFFNKGYLTGEEFDLCGRLYAMLRELLPPPDLMIYLKAPVEVVARRYRRRNRELEIATLDDLAALECLLEEWIGSLKGIPLTTIDVAVEDPIYAQVTSTLLSQIERLA